MQFHLLQSAPICFASTPQDGWLQVCHRCPRDDTCLSQGLQAPSSNSIGSSCREKLPSGPDHGDHRNRIGITYALWSFETRWGLHVLGFELQKWQTNPKGTSWIKLAVAWTGGRHQVLPKGQAIQMRPRRVPHSWDTKPLSHSSCAHLHYPHPHTKNKKV